MMEITQSDKLLNSKTNFFPWIFLFISLFLVFSLFAFFYPISTFKSYDGYIEKSDKYIVKIYVPQKQFHTLNHSTFYVNHEKRNGKILSIKPSSELGLMAGYFELTLDLKLTEEEKIENNIIQVLILEREETLVEKWNRTWKERINSWLS